MPKEKQTKDINSSPSEKPKENPDDRFSDSLDRNINIFKDIFKNDDTISFRSFENRENRKARLCIVFANGMIDSETIYKSIIQPIMEFKASEEDAGILDLLYYKVIISDTIERTSDINKMVQSIIIGDTLLMIDGESQGMIIGSRGWKTRSIEEPESEKAVRAPREGFTESIMVNLSLIRRKLQTKDLKFNYKTIGVRSHTKVCLCYIDGIANERILQELNKRLDGIDIDAVLSTSYIEELIMDHPYSIFDTIGYTERPDIIAANLLEGRIAIFVDNTSFVLTIPHIFMEYFQANEDYYEGFYTGSIIRLIRILGFFLSITVPALYISLTTFHQELIPTPLILSIFAARADIPFPTVVSALGMIIIFEILREAGSRMPTYIGQALSIVGALVVGQAAVEARLIEAPMVIVIAFTSITSLMIQRIKTPALILRVIMLILAAVIGIYGMLAGFIGMLIYLLSMRSFGVPYMDNTDITSTNFQDLKDTYIRAPWWYMKKRPRLIAVRNIIRKSSGGKKT